MGNDIVASDVASKSMKCFSKGENAEEKLCLGKVLLTDCLIVKDCMHYIKE